MGKQIVQAKRTTFDNTGELRLPTNQREKKMFQLINQETKEIAFTGNSFTECRDYGIKKGIIGVEKSKNFRHLIFEHWNIERVTNDDGLRFKMSYGLDGGVRLKRVS